MGIMNFIEQMRSKLDIIKTIHKGIKITRENETEIHFHINHEKLNLDQMRIVSGVENKKSCGGKAVFAELYILSKAFSQGLKVYKIKDFDYDVVENIEIRIPVRNYEQPFETVVIEFPDDYLSKRSVECPQKDHWLHQKWGGLDEKGQHKPNCLILNLNKELKIILGTLIFSTMQMYNFCLMDKVGDGQTIEKEIRLAKIREHEDSLETSEEERNITFNIIRAGINLMLFATEYGSRNVGPMNPNHYARLKKRNDQKEINLHPVVYEINQKIRLFRNIPKDITTTDLRLVHQGPHWRSGHWKMQPCGIKGLERKRIFVQAYFVGAEIFGGDMSETKVEIS